MRKCFILSLTTAFATLALGACGKGGGGNVAMEPGEWETTMELVRLNTDNLPPDIRDGMRASSRRSETQRGCWTMSADLVRIENLRFTIPERALQGASCTIPELVMEGGTLRGQVNCQGFPGPYVNGARQTVSFTSEVDGNYTADSVRATARGEVRFGTQSGGGEVRITSRRIGACPPPRPYYSPPPYIPGDSRAPTEMNDVMAVPVPDPGQSAREAVNEAARAARDAQAQMGR